MSRQVPPACWPASTGIGRRAQQPGRGLQCGSAGADHGGRFRGGCCRMRPPHLRQTVTSTANTRARRLTQRRGVLDSDVSVGSAASRPARSSGSCWPGSSVSGLGTTRGVMPRSRPARTTRMIRQTAPGGSTPDRHQRGPTARGRIPGLAQRRAPCVRRGEGTPVVGGPHRRSATDLGRR